MNKTIKNISVTIIIAISFSIVRTSAFCDYQKQETFENGYEQAIEDAVLVEFNENGYILSFNGELHSYTFESKTGKAFENGYEQAIEDAVLVSSNEVGYILSFNGELHNYTFD